MSRSSVMFTEDWVVNDCSSHYLQGQSIKRTVSEQASMTFREFFPSKTAVSASGMEFAIWRLDGINF
jgi:hypothetical protein